MIICEICKKEFKSLNALGNHIAKSEKISVKEYYNKYLLKNNENKCYCGNDTRFISLGQGYSKNCSITCSNRNPEIKLKKEATCIKNYGVSNPNKSKIVLEKTKKTNLSRYGVEYGAQNREIRQKMEDTLFKNYGVKSPLKSEKLKKKAKETTLKNHGVEYSFMSKNIRDKSKLTLLKKYGVDNYANTAEYRIKYINTSIERYGKDSYSKTTEYKERCKQTNLTKFGKFYNSQTDEYKEKFKTTCLKHFNVDNPLKSDIIKEKLKNTFMITYGVENYSQTSEFKEKYKITKYKKFYENITTGNRLDNKVLPLFKFEDYQGINFKYSWKCNTCSTEFDCNIVNGKIPRCPSCYPLHTSSLAEKEISEFCKQYYPNLIENDRTEISPLELDIYIPELNLAIEYHGLYWHSELNGKDRNYHLNKYLKCKEKGIKLVQIFEDEWINKQEIVKSILLNKLKNITTKIHGRKCIIKEIDNNTASEFLNNNHIQGNINSNVRIGLFYNEELVSLLTLGKSRFNKNFEYEIHRFCNKLNTNIPGAFSKALKYFINKYKPINIITYADLRYGDGSVYLYNNFKFINMSKPNYYYIKDGLIRNSRQKFQKHKLSTILESYDETLTEWENMQLNDYDRIWDTGNAVFTLKLGDDKC